MKKKKTTNNRKKDEWILIGMIIAIFLQLRKYFFELKGDKKMLTKRQNLTEVMKCGNPDRFVK